MSAGDAVALLAVGVAFVGVSVWFLRRGRIGDISLSFRRGSYEGQFLDGRDPRMAMAVVVGWGLIGLGCLVRGVWVLAS